LKADLLRRCIFVCQAFVSPLPAVAADPLTINREQLEPFAQVYRDRPGTVRVLSFGDSMADSYRSISFHMISRMLEQRPLAGASFNNSFGSSLFSSTNGASAVPPSALWFSHQFRIPAGASAQWTSTTQPQGLRANHLGVYWIAQPSGGAFRIMISAAGAPWAELAQLNGYAPQPIGSVTNFSLSLTEYRVQVQSLSGTNFLLGPELVNTQTKGLHVAWLDYGGITVQQVVSVPRAIRDPILQAFAPDLLLWHFKEGYSALSSLPAALAENEDWFVSSSPNMQVLYFGTPYASDSAAGAHTVAENNLVRDFAAAHNRPFVDCMTPGISFDWLQSNGYMADQVHPSSSGGAFLAEAAWHDLGLASRFADRRLSLTRSGGALLLETTLSPGLIYSFESSVNLTDWITFHTRTNESGAAQIRIAPQAEMQNFRFRFAPMD
jgi:hypothetical protein